MAGLLSQWLGLETQPAPAVGTPSPPGASVGRLRLGPIQEVPPLGGGPGMAFEPVTHVRLLATCEGSRCFGL